MIYVISDTPKLKLSFAKNSSCFELRSIVQHKQNLVITSDNRNILDYVKHHNDNFVVTSIHPSLLKTYCLKHKKGILHVTKCFCDISTKKEVCNMEEYHYTKKKKPSENKDYFFDALGVGESLDEEASFLFR